MTPDPIIMHCAVCGADEASTYLGAPGPGIVRCFAVGCDAQVGGFATDEEAIAEWNRRAEAMDTAMTEAYRAKGLQHPEYAHGISDAELIKEAIAFCDEELDGYEGMEYDDDCEVCCQRSNTFIRELVRRLNAEMPAYWVRHRLSDGRATFWETEVPDSYPLYRRASTPAPRETLAPSSALSSPAGEMAQCCMCGKKGLSIVEGDGGPECELSDGRWVCSAECWDKAVEPSPASDIAALREYAHEATKVITGLAGGGSENFSGQIGNMFKADLEFCAKKIRDRHETIHGLVVRAKKENDAMREENERLKDAITSIPIELRKLAAKKFAEDRKAASINIRNAAQLAEDIARSALQHVAKGERG